MKIRTDHKMIITLDMEDIFSLYMSMRTQKTQCDTRIKLVEALFDFCERLPDKVGCRHVPVTVRKAPEIYKNK